MVDRAHVHALMTEIGPALELAEVQEFERDNLWTLVVDQGTVLFAEYDPDDARLWLSADVCAPQPGDRSKLYELMLQYNARWRQTGGVRLALDGPGGTVVQAYDMTVNGLDLSRLCTVVGNFRETLAAWREIVAASVTGREADAGRIDPVLMGGVIRG